MAGRSSMLVFPKERFGKTDMQSRARSKYLEPEGGRFVPPLKPACSRDKGPDPYDTFKHMNFVIKDTGCTPHCCAVSPSRYMLTPRIGELVR